MHGEVEVLDGAAKDPEHAALAVLGRGSFFGEKSLLNTEPRITSVRARTSVEVLVIGKNVFTQISPALGPLRDSPAQTLNCRTLQWEANT